ncbi:MAG TPA: TetR/AcrR family transcriptional regulator [Caulobacteraceae bacterium]|jgi:AcrR family transcriptional regulator
MTIETPTESARADAKRRAIVEVARQVFLSQGYAAASMSEIAARVGGSKGTLYNYFRSKEELFSAFMTETCDRLATAFRSIPPIGQGRSVRDSLIDIGLTLMQFLMTDDFMAMHRLVLSEIPRFPEIGRMFYEAGPAKGEARFTGYFVDAMAAGRFPAGDPQAVGQRLKDLVLSDLYLRRMWGVLDGLTDAELRAHVADSVDVFLMVYAPELSGAA